MDAMGSFQKAGNDLQRQLPNIPKELQLKIGQAMKDFGAAMQDFGKAAKKPGKQGMGF